MRPTSVEGFWFETNEIKKVKLEGGWLYALSPRGTTKWYDAGKSIGVYSGGVNVDGSKSQYSNNLESKGVDLANPKAVGVAMKSSNAIVYRLDIGMYTLMSTAHHTTLKTYSANCAG
jgi:hypothetical protein